MAAFASVEAAEIRAYAKVNDNTWVAAFAGRNKSGTIIVRILRFASVSAGATFDGMSRAGAWDELTDDATT